MVAKRDDLLNCLRLSALCQFDSRQSLQNAEIGLVWAYMAKGIAPRRLSFTNTLKILRCRLPEVPRGERGRRRWYCNLLAEIGAEVLEPRRNRINPRVIKRKMSGWAKKRPHHRHYPQPAKEFRQAVVMLN